MTPSVLDHLYVVLLALVFPAFDYFRIRRRAARIRGGETELRMSFYRGIVGEEWISTIVVVATWFALGRGAAELGFVPETGWLAWAGYALAVLICVALVLQARSVLASAEQRERMRSQFGWMGDLMPHTRAELRAFDRVSITAGICEEIVFRGYITAYLVALFGLPFWAAAVGSSVLFGLVHSYQGPTGALRAGGIGSIFALLYGMTGSLWAPILAHAVTDITSARIAFGSFRPGAAEDSPTLAVRESAAAPSPGASSS